MQERRQEKGRAWCCTLVPGHLVLLNNDSHHHHGSLGFGDRDSEGSFPSVSLANVSHWLNATVKDFTHMMNQQFPSRRPDAISFSTVIVD